MKFPEYFQPRHDRIEKILEQFLPPSSSEPQRLHQAMRYAVLNGGKRIRPLLVYATGEMLGARLPDLDYAASAVELIHCYSLIHDDLPAMDNDDLRRGQPTCHKAFDEATAILAGDALQTLAFAMLLQPASLNTETRLQTLAVLAEACGSSGMAGGQALDLQAVGRSLPLQELTKMHNLKTGALIRASVKLGALIGNASPQQHTALDNFAKNIGLAFQIQDDILDLESSTEVLGKPHGSDSAQNKPTYPALIGMTDAKKEVEQLYNNAIKNLQIFKGDAEALISLASYIVNRIY